MAEPSIDIDRIVREVLAELGRASQPGMPAPAGPQCQRSPATAQPEVAGDAADGDLVLSCRVVTTSQVEGRLEAVRRLVLLEGAVITPSVRDELRRRNVALVYAAAAPPQAAGRLRLALVTAGKRFDPATLISALNKEGIRVDPHTSDCLIAATDRLAEEVVRPDTLGLLLTRHTAAALCLANRHRGVRAVLATNAQTIAADAASVGANLLIVDPTVAGVFQLKQLTTEFCREGARPCPEVYRERLA